MPGLTGLMLSLFVLAHAIAVELAMISWVLVFGFGTATTVAASKPVRMRVVVAWATASPLIVLASIGLAVVIGPSFALLLLLAGLTHPISLRKLRGLFPYCPGRHAAALYGGVATSGRSAERAPAGDAGGPMFSEVVAPSTVASLSDAQLCLDWRRSYLVLERLHQEHDGLHPGYGAAHHLTSCKALTAQQQQLVVRRQEYLDELERRDQAGFRRWLYGGARPASDPSRYLHTHRGTPTTSTWS